MKALMKINALNFARPIPDVGKHLRRPVPAVQISTTLHKDTQDMPTFDHVWKLIQSDGCMNTEYMGVRRGKIMLEFNRYVLCPVGG